jgi:hypothetical protein
MRKFRESENKDMVKDTKSKGFKWVFIINIMDAKSIICSALN